MKLPALLLFNRPPSNSRCQKVYFCWNLHTLFLKKLYSCSTLISNHPCVGPSSTSIPVITVLIPFVFIWHSRSFLRTLARNTEYLDVMVQPRSISLFILLVFASAASVGQVWAAVPPESFMDTLVIDRPLNLSGRSCCTSPGTVGCCEGPGLTYDRCTDVRICASPRYCYLEYTDQPCPFNSVDYCHCVPLQMISCTNPSQCPVGETCAKGANGIPYCYSAAVVSIDSSFTIYYGSSCCTTDCQNPCSSSSPLASYSPLPPSSSPYQSYPPQSPSSPPLTQSPWTSPSASPSRVQTYSSSPMPPSTSPPTQPSTMMSPSYQPSYYPPLTLTPRPTRSPSTESPGLASPSPSGGLCGDPCSPVNPCLKWRECLRPDRLPCDATCSAGICMNSMVCRCSDDCEDGEVCAGAYGTSYCFSPRVVNQPGITVYPCSPPGQTGDRCDDDSDCDNRTCVRGGGDTCADGNILCGRDRVRCEGNYPYGCYCDQYKQCTCTTDCEVSEVCCATSYGRICVSKKVVQNSTVLEPEKCEDDEVIPGFGQSYVVKAPEPPKADMSNGLSPSASSNAGGGPAASPSSGSGGGSGSSGSPVGGGVCVDVRSLDSFTREELIFRDHVRNAVFCDAFESCATPGHMVLYKGLPMTMRKYCDIVGGCSRKVVWVNSPKFRRRLKFASKTNNLLFTPFASKYETRLEEILLSLAIRSGL